MWETTNFRSRPVDPSRSTQAMIVGDDRTTAILPGVGTAIDGSGTDPVAELIRTEGVRCVFTAGEVLLRQGQPAQGLFLIESGMVEIVDTRNHVRIDRDTVGGVLGELSLLTGQTCSATVVAQSIVTAWFLEKSRYRDVCNADPQFELRLAHLLSGRLGHHSHDALCGKTINGYRILECINRGAMGVIYRAEDPAGQPVALKMLMHKYIENETMHQRFDQEARLLHGLDHPNIVRMHDHFRAYRTRFLVLGLCSGCDLYTALRNRGSLSESDARAVLGQIALGLQAAHAKQILHRDLKPANVLVDRGGRVSVTDFGLSRLREIEVEETYIVGTPAYMAPELFTGKPAGFSADWYALGCVAYELVAGKLLFQCQETRELYRLKSVFNIDRFLAEEKPRLAAAGEHLSDAYLSLLKNTLARFPERRSLDLTKLARWAEPVPELVPDPDQ